MLVIILTLLSISVTSPSLVDMLATPFFLPLLEALDWAFSKAVWASLAMSAISLGVLRKSAILHHAIRTSRRHVAHALGQSLFHQLQARTFVGQRAPLVVPFSRGKSTSTKAEVETQVQQSLMLLVNSIQCVSRW